MFRAAFGNHRLDLSRTQYFTDFCLSIVGTVGQGFIRSFLTIAVGGLYRRNGIDDRYVHLRVMNAVCGMLDAFLNRRFSIGA